MSADTVENPSISARQNFEFVLEGSIEVSWQSQHTIRMHRVRLSIVEESDYVTDIVLEAEFDPFSAMKLVNAFPAMQAVADGVMAYAFTMKPEVRAVHQAEFDDAAFLDDWLQIGDGAILHLENYICIGRGNFEDAVLPDSGPVA